jgi:ribosomal protein S18 acetylase RimI-like enzyme
MSFEIARGDSADIDQLETLWLQMLSYHRALVDDRFPIRAAEPSWELARSDYQGWLSNDTAMVLTARGTASSEPLGYAVCRLVGGRPTFDLGPVRGDVDSLVVRDLARGWGVGTALLESVRDELLNRGISYWSIGVLAHNREAAKLYERVGFRPWSQALLAKTKRT